MDKNASNVLQEIYELLTPIVRVLSHKNRDVGVARLIEARIQPERPSHYNAWPLWVLLGNNYSVLIKA